jgi:hypothetical protein
MVQTRKEFLSITYAKLINMIPCLSLAAIPEFSPVKNLFSLSQQSAVHVTADLIFLLPKNSVPIFFILNTRSRMKLNYAGSSCMHYRSSRNSIRTNTRIPIQ